MRWIAAAVVMLAGCGQATPDAKDGPSGRQFDAAERANGDHCLGQFIPHLDALGAAVMLKLPSGENYTNDRTFTRGFDRGQRQAVMEFTLAPSGRKGAAIALLDPANCTAGEVAVKIAVPGDPAYPIGY